MHLCSQAIVSYGFVYEGCVQVFVCTFVKFIQTNIGLVMSVCPSVLKEQIGNQMYGFHYIIYYLWKYIDKIQVSLKAVKNNGKFLEDRCTVIIIFFSDFFL
jgi:hypothetical protein